MTNRTFPTISAAMDTTPYPEENLPALNHLVEALKLGPFTVTSSYIRAERANGPDIRIASGWVNGFTSEDEALTALGDFIAKPWRSQRSEGLWGATLPVSGRGNTAGSRRDAPEPEICGSCYQQLPRTGVCDQCE